MQNSIKNKCSSDYCDVTLATTISQRVISSCVGVIFIVVVLFMFYAEYTQKRNIPGIVYPDKGIISIKSRTSGILSVLYKKSGDYVKSGESLFVIDASSSTHFFKNNEENYWEIISKLNAITRRDAQNNVTALESRKKLTEEQLAQTMNSIEILKNQIKLLDIAIKSQEISYKKIHDAYKKKYVSDIEKNNAEMQLIEKKMQRQSLENEVLSKEDQVISLNKDLNETSVRIKDVKNEYEKESAQSLMKMNTFASDAESILHSPTAGKVAEIVERTGSFINAGETILTIIPKGSVNQIVAFISPDLIGEIKKGTRVSLKYDSYPYQRFGVEHGVITDISTVPLQPEDIYTNFGIKFEKASFRLGIEITDHQRNINIIPGMSLKVEIPTRKASIIKWLFPFFREKI